MSAHHNQAAVGLRAYFNSFIAFFLLLFSFSILLNHLQTHTHVVPPAPSILHPQEQEREQQESSSTFLVDVDVTQLRRGRDQQQHEQQQTEEDDQGGQCDFSVGRWVYDNTTRPLYRGPQCQFMHDEVACDKYGRNNTRYQHWRWQPKGCDLPRFDANTFLEKIRGKRMVFVGDSLNRNQWVSMVCLVESVVPAEHKTRTFNGSLMSFKVLSHNASIDFYWSPLLVESNCDNPIIHRVSSRIMRAHTIDNHAKNWMDADIIVFNAYVWWKQPNMKMKVWYGSFEDGDATLEEVEMFEGFQIAIKSWAQWLERNLNNTDKRLFFVSLSPTHVL